MMIRQIDFSLKLLGVSLVLSGLLINEFLLTEFFSNDFELESITLLKIRIFNVTVVCLGLLIIFVASIRRLLINLTMDVTQHIGNLVVIPVGVLLIIMMSMQFFEYSKGIHENADFSAIIVAQDFEPAKHISIVKTARWDRFHNTNKYGPLYFRLARIIATFRNFSTNFEDPLIETEKFIHASLQFVSLISFFGISYLLATFIVNNIFYRLLSMAMISTVLSSNELWVSLVFRATPDMLVSVFIAAYILSILLGSRMEELSKASYISGIAVAAAVATKVLVAPFFLIATVVFGSSLDRLALHNVLRFVGTAAVTYLVLTFPIWLKFEQTLKGIFELGGSLMRPPNWESALDWGSLLITDSMLGVVVLILICQIVPVSLTIRTGQPRHLKTFAASAIGVITLLFCFRYIQPNIENHILPFSVLAYFSAICIGLSFKRKMSSCKSARAEKISRIFSVVVVSLILISIGLVPPAISKSALKQIEKRNVTHETYDQITRLTSLDPNRPIMFLETHVPWWHEDKRVVEFALNATASDLELNQPDIIILNTRYIQDFLHNDQLSEFWRVGRDNIEEIRAYYRLFEDRYQTEDPFGDKWIVIYEDSRGIQIWEKQESDFSNLRKSFFESECNCQ